MAYCKPYILFFGIALTTFGIFAFDYFMGMGGERKAIGVVLAILGWYIGVLFLCEASSYKKERRKRK